jgi:hypothetical protein
MDQPRRHNPTTLALYAIAVLLLLNLVATLAKNGSPSFLSIAAAQNRQAPIAGGAGLFVMPAQLSNTVWGAYLMDVDRGTLCVYQYLPGSKRLELVASRQITYDRDLKNFNTQPAPQEIRELVEKEAQGLRANPNEPPAQRNP